LALFVIKLNHSSCHIILHNNQSPLLISIIHSFTMSKYSTNSKHIRAGSNCPTPQPSSSVKGKERHTASSSFPDKSRLDSSGLQSSVENPGPSVQNGQPKQLSKRDAKYQEEVEAAPLGLRPCMYSRCSGILLPGNSHKLQPVDQFQPVESKPGQIKTSCNECRNNDTLRRKLKKGANPAKEKRAKSPGRGQGKKAPPQEADLSIKQEENDSGGVEDQPDDLSSDPGMIHPDCPFKYCPNLAEHSASVSAMMRGSISHYDMPSMVPAPGGNCGFQIGPINGPYVDYITSALLSNLLPNDSDLFPLLLGMNTQNQMRSPMRSIPGAPERNAAAGPAGENPMLAGRPPHGIDSKPQDMTVAEEDIEFFDWEKYYR
jgi:hypothetical protein